METVSFTPEDIKQNKDWAALSYFWLFSLIVLIARPNSPFAQFHARQGVVLFLLSFLFWPFGIFRSLEVILLVFSILGCVQAALGQAYRLPLIADLSEGNINLSTLRQGWASLKRLWVKRP